jgi:uncharacterized cupredoxin-like copper-binding protein
MVVTTLGSLGVFAESGHVTQPLTANTIEVQLNDDYFNPKVINIPNGKMSMLVLKNVGNKEHTFTVTKLGIDVEVQPGQTKTITVQPKMPGTYELACRYHYNQGMVGNVIVK